MENFKRVHFKKEYPDNEFPWWRQLTSEEMRFMRQTIAQKIGEGHVADLLSLTTMVAASGELVDNVNAADEGFVLADVLKGLQIKPEKKICINWYRFDDIDEMIFEDLNRYFDDIWYPNSDDIEIFDSTFMWILSISHHGSVKIVQFSR